MSAKSGVLLEPYGKAGPFGETLWYFLSEVRLHFINALVERFLDLDESEAEQALKLFRREGIVQADRFRERIENDRSKIIKIFEETWVWPDGTNKCETVYAERVEQLKFYARKIRSHFEDIPLNLFVGKVKAREVNRDAKSAITTALQECIWPYLFIRHNAGGKDLNITWLAELDLLLTPSARRIRSDSLLYPSLRPLCNKRGTRIYSSVDHWTNVGSHILSREVVESERLDIGHVRMFDDDHVEPRVEGNWLERAPRRSRLSDWFYWNQSGARFCLDQEGHLTRTKSDVVALFYWCTPLPSLLPSISDILNGILPVSPKHGGGGVEGSRLESIITPTVEAIKIANGSSLIRSLRRRLADHYAYIERLEIARKQLDFGVISHSIKNLFTKNRPKDNAVFERRIWLEQALIEILLDTSDELDWDDGYSANVSQGSSESYTATISEAWNSGNLVIDFEALENGPPVKSAFLAVSVEIVRNASFYGKAKGYDNPLLVDDARFRVVRNSRNLFDCVVSTGATPSDAESVEAELRSYHTDGLRPGSSMKGLWGVLYFLADLVTDASEVLWKFRVPGREHEKDVSFIYCVKNKRRGRIIVENVGDSVTCGCMEILWTNLKLT